MPKWGFAGSPVVYGDTLIVQVGGEALIFGLDKRTGEILWKSEAAPASYSTPVIISDEGKDLLLVIGGQTFFVLDPHNGETLWQFPWEMENNLNICTPVYSVEHKIALISAWYKKGTGAFKIGGNKYGLHWLSTDLNAHQIDPIILRDHVYGFSGMSVMNRNDFMCLDLLTGEKLWATKALGSGQFIYIEPYFLSIDIKGNLYLSKGSPEGLEVVTSVKDLVKTDKARLWTKPIAAQGNLYLRYANQLYCYRLAEN
jgi:outer membrane protein assembly factor BamB